jgi:hypothetical protein
MVKAESLSIKVAAGEVEVRSWHSGKLEQGSSPGCGSKRPYTEWQRLVGKPEFDVVTAAVRRSGSREENHVTIECWSGLAVISHLSTGWSSPVGSPVPACEAKGS